MAEAIIAVSKTCRRCGLMFSGRKCRPCTNAAAALYRKENPEKVKAAIERCRAAAPEQYRQMHKSWRERNAEYLATSKAEYYANNSESILAKQRTNYQFNAAERRARSSEYYAKNLSKIRVSRQAYYRRNSERIIKRAAEWRSKNTGLASANVKAWAAAHPEKVKAIHAEWRANNPDAIRSYHQNRRARKQRSGGKLSPDIVATLFKLQRGKCACCGKKLGRKFHLDHRVPLVRGGAHADHNMQLLTPTCNLQKHAKDPIDFMQERGFLL